MDGDAHIELAMTVARGFPAATQGQPFGEGAEVFTVVGKIFAIISTQAPFYVTLKCAPPHGRALALRYASVIPGYHMNKQHWISVLPGSDADETLVEDLVDNSYDLVVSTLPRDRRPFDTARSPVDEVEL